MFSSEPQSEYEPLISNPRISLQPTEKRTRTYSFKTGLCLILLLVAASLFVYFIFPRRNSMTPPFSKTYNWVRMEESHEHAAHIPARWAEKEECSSDHPFELTLALKQQNTEALHEHVASVSHPSGDAFHEYWTADKVRNYFKPTNDAVDAVTSWLTENGFTAANGKMKMVTTYGNVMRVSLTCGDANGLLNAQYMNYESTDGRTHLRVKDGVYNIPDTVHEHIDFVSPTIRFPIQRHTLSVHTMSKTQIDSLKSHTKDFKQSGFTIKSEEDEDTDSDITPNIPSRLYELYGMTDAVSQIFGDNTDDLDTSVCRQSIASFIEQYYNDNDIEMFHEDLDVYPESPMERIPATQPQGYGSEAELDTQYITSTGKGIYTYVYYIESDDIFVSLAESILDTEIPPLVVSISYGADEYELGQDWVTRCNQEFGKLALIGTTVLASSGDSGIRGNDDDCSYSGTPEEERNGRHLLRSVGQGAGHGTSKAAPVSSTSTGYAFVASFPASAPYVTAVGGTEGGEIQDDASSSTGETAWLYSGGGFSMYFDTPEWQTSAVNDYLSRTDITYPDESRYVSGGRAYPDISAQSVDYVIAYDEAFYLVSGTSASSPTVAGMISTINYARIEAGKTPLGFLNPALYSLYDDDQNLYFNDVTEGYNIGCECDDNIGFSAATGWDPITGLGTPKFTSLYEALLAMD
eukprot:59795_1